jgi:DNA repair and recombination protein RAD54 and RAD54-like protein
MSSRSKYSRLGSEAEEEEEAMVDVSSDSDDSESEADRAAGADEGDDEYVGESSDAGDGDDVEGVGSTDSGEGGDGDGQGDVRQASWGGRRRVAAPDKERKSQNVDALVRYDPTRPFRPARLVDFV